MRSRHNFVVALLALQAAAAFAVRASAIVAAPASLVWEVLTDYDNLARFIPGLSRSMVELRRANRVQLQQNGEARFLFFAYPIDVRLEVVESPRDSITSRAVGGNLRRMNGTSCTAPPQACG